MEQILIRGGVPLQGEVHIQGAKNAALPILAAALLADGEHEIRNCPKIADVYHMIDLLILHGAVIKWKDRDLYVDTRNVHPISLEQSETETMRSNIFLLGAQLGRFQEADLQYPGGCVIGNRPINWHMQHLNQMGAVFCEHSDRIIARAVRMKGCEHILSFPSVGVTENLILAAVMADGITVIRGAAREPEIAALCDFLVSAGARIEGIGKKEIVIHGVKRLFDGKITLSGDRIVAGTYAFACMITGGSVLLKEAPVQHMNRMIPMLHAMGADTVLQQDGLFVQRRHRLRAIPLTQTQVYPGFPTDLQSQLLAVLCVAEGDSAIEERIFENRFRIVPQLQKMGAKIHVDGSFAFVKGVEKLYGTILTAEELRGGAALVLAGLGAEGETRVEQCRHIYRGYENICRDLSGLGARIYSE